MVKQKENWWILWNKLRVPGHSQLCAFGYTVVFNGTRYLKKEALQEGYKALLRRQIYSII